MLRFQYIWKEKVLIGFRVTASESEPQFGNTTICWPTRNMKNVGLEWKEVVSSGYLLHYAAPRCNSNLRRQLSIMVIPHLTAVHGQLRSDATWPSSSNNLPSRLLTCANLWPFFHFIQNHTGYSPPLTTISIQSNGVSETWFNFQGCMHGDALRCIDTHLTPTRTEGNRTTLAFEYDEDFWAHVHQRV